MVGLGLDFIGINPVKALIYSAILYGLTAPVIIAIILHVANNKRIMRHNTNNWLSNIFGFLTLIVMTAAAGFLIYALIK